MACERAVPLSAFPRRDQIFGCHDGSKDCVQLASQLDADAELAAAIAAERGYVIAGLALIALIGSILGVCVLCSNVSKYELLCWGESIEGRTALSCAEECGDFFTSVHDIFSPCLPCLCPDCKEPRQKRDFLRSEAEERRLRAPPAAKMARKL